ncbi:MAG: hypothetical protein WCT23_09055, partial [Candidatus Neomarinimicrobiota bacterium]
LFFHFVMLLFFIFQAFLSDEADNRDAINRRLYFPLKKTESQNVSEILNQVQNDPFSLHLNFGGRSFGRHGAPQSVMRRTEQL